MLVAADVTVTLGRRKVIEGVSLSAHAGTLTAIVGPNGSGKTTLLRALTGDVAATGRITLNGLDLKTTRPPILAAIRAVLAQATPLAFPFTVIEVVRLGQGTGLAAAQADVPRQALARVGLAGFEARFFQELSGGEQARVHLARVLAQVWQPVGPDGPRWLFLDEPVASLDIGHQLQVMGLARAYADAGGGVVAVMHDLNLTAMFADAVALIGEGRIMGQGRPDDILTNVRLSRAYGCTLRVNALPPRGPWVLPQAAGLLPQAAGPLAV